MKIINFKPVAQANAQTYKESDPALWQQMKAVLIAIEQGAPRARETPIRVGATPAWSVSVVVHGRDAEYQVLWAPDPHNDQTVWIVHLGQRLRP